ncbi:MAG: GNAT family N-acetyltransferase [Rhodospirillaceae bacterium]|nr:GNAT family N-acetyltransferase [Rhodospirillaceae bacterium]
MLDLRIKTQRLTLRPYVAADAKRIQALAGLREIAMMTGPSIPHPYPDGAAEAWIAKQGQRRFDGQSHAFAIDIDGALAGSVGFEDGGKGTHFELGYWLGKPYWGRGYVSEAAAAVVEYAFGWLNHPALVAGYHIDNPASGRVLAKLGFVETHRRMAFQHVRQCEVELVRMLLTKDAWAAKRV